MNTAFGDFVTLRLIRGCALDPLDASALGGKTSSPYGKVRAKRGAGGGNCRDCITSCAIVTLSLRRAVTQGH